MKRLPFITQATLKVTSHIFILALAMSLTSASAQTPPTATEEFNLRIRCKKLADVKAESLETRPLTAADGASLGWSTATVEAMNRNFAATTEILLLWHSSRYDAKNNRCYMEYFSRKKFGPHKENEMEMRQIYDTQTDDLLAFTQILNEEKVGIVFDKGHRIKTDTNLGWDNANSYIDEMMADKRN